MGLTRWSVSDSASSGEDKRERWTSRAAFYFAAIGAAVGFGNVWRFPALSFEYGGGAFFIPYLLALFIVGIPLAILEVGLGQFFQCGDVGVFGGFNRRLRGVGVSSVACGFMLVTYYSMLIAWCINAFFDSFTDDTVWKQENIDGATAVQYFQDEIIGTSTLPEDGTPSRIVGANAGYSLLVWFIVFMGIGFGVRWTGRITYFTMGLPIVLLFVFLIRACTLEGAGDGIKAYIGVWDVSVLRERGDVWSTAVGQIFFSIGVTFGILTALASYLPRNEPAACNSMVIACANSTFSFIAGFAVFASLGYASYLSGVPIEDMGFGGFSLVFGTWPVILSTLPGGIHWVRLLFVNLFLLGIDSAFAFVEANVTVVRDTNTFHLTPKWKATLAVCVVGYGFSLIYATDAGLNFLDVIDFYINFVMLIVGFFETFAAGWVYGWKNQIETLGKGAVVSQLIANFGSVSLACGIWFGVDPDDGGVWGGFVALIGFYLAGMGVAAYYLKKKMAEDPGEWTWKTILWELVFGNIFALRDRIVPVIQRIPAIWCILIKQFLPHVLLILFVNLAQSTTSTGETVFGSYGGYVTRPFQVLGILTFVFAATLFVVGLLFPFVYEPLRLPDGHFGLDPEGEEAKKNGDKDMEVSEQASEQAPGQAFDDVPLEKAEMGEAATESPELEEVEMEA